MFYSLRTPKELMKICKLTPDISSTEQRLSKNHEGKHYSARKQDTHTCPTNPNKSRFNLDLSPATYGRLQIFDNPYILFAVISRCSHLCVYKMKLNYRGRCYAGGCK